MQVGAAQGRSGKKGKDVKSKGGKGTGELMRSKRTPRSGPKRTRSRRASTARRQVTPSVLAGTESVTEKKAKESGEPFVGRQQVAAITDDHSEEITGDHRGHPQHGEHESRLRVGRHGGPDSGQTR